MRSGNLASIERGSGHCMEHGLPIARIDLIKGKADSLRTTISHIVYQAMVLKAPTDGRFQVIAESETDDLIYPESFLGMEAQLPLAPTVA
jgi:hypothetical protein